MLSPDDLSGLAFVLEGTKLSILDGLVYLGLCYNADEYNDNDRDEIQGQLEKIFFFECSWCWTWASKDSLGPFGECPHCGKITY